MHGKNSRMAWLVSTSFFRAFLKTASIAVSMALGGWHIFLCSLWCATWHSRPQ